MDKYLKTKNAPFVWTFLGVNIALLLAIRLSGTADLASLNAIWSQLTLKDGIAAAALPILAVILAGVLGDTGKARIVFWRLWNPLPGCRAFSRFVHEDPRINGEVLMAKLGEFPAEPRQQNALWYKLYKLQAEKMTIVQAHKVYLLTRDLAAVSAVLLCLFPVALIASSMTLRLKLGHTGYLVVQYVITAAAARNYGNRFVTNVLVEESLNDPSSIS